MKTCTNGLKCPTSLQCGIGCYFNEADLSPVCCTSDCNQGRSCPARNAPLHTKNGGNVIDHGEALRKPVYTGDDLIDPATNWFAVGSFVCGMLWVAVMVAVIYRARGVS